jgi:hypothetical protein
MDNASAINGHQSTEPGHTPKLTPAEADALIPPPTRAKRGFAVLSPEKKREIASMGGKAAHEHGRAHRFTSEEARAAGKKRHQLRMMAAAQAADGTHPPVTTSATPADGADAHPTNGSLHNGAKR